MDAPPEERAGGVERHESEAVLGQLSMGRLREHESGGARRVLAQKAPPGRAHCDERYTDRVRASSNPPSGVS